MEGRKDFKNIFLPFLEKKKLDAYEIQDNKKELLHFCGERHVAGDGVFSNDLLFVWLEGNRIRFAIVSILC